MKIKRRYILILSAVLVLLALSVVLTLALTQGDPKDVFPVWYEAAAISGSQYAELSFAGIERVVSSDDGHEAANIVISIKNTHTEKAMRYSAEYHLDYYYRSEGKWYTVYEGYPVSGWSGALDPLEESKQQYTIDPSEILDVKGEYRLYADGFGYCNFEIK